eukprot:TRINITY_DN3428_c0_g1_i11.p1 TRINITY_DN3428_c0_g1~~TRINITY_DN3428_c0_g1_i11.p1  ORF type:complete len:654 (+),score=156.67 TRINITY_DN3428_c0_g1_i11:1731-3692(+)
MSSLNRNINSRSSAKGNREVDRSGKGGKSGKNSTASDQMKLSCDPLLYESPPDPMKMTVPVPSTVLPVAQPPPVLKGYKTNEKNVSTEQNMKGHEPHLMTSASSSAVKKVSPSRIQNLFNEPAKTNKQGKTPTKPQAAKTNSKAKTQNTRTEVRKPINSTTKVKNNPSKEPSISSKPDNSIKNYSHDEEQNEKLCEESIHERSKDCGSDIEVRNSLEESDNLRSDPEELREKLKELDIEIDVLKQEQAAIEKQKTEYDALIMALQTEMENFYKQKEEDMAAFELEKQEFRKQMARKQAELEAKSANDEAHELLRRENQQLREELKAKDQAHSNSLDTMKTEMEKVIKTNEELQKKVAEIVGQKKSQNKLNANASQTRIKTPEAKSGGRNMLASRASKPDTSSSKHAAKASNETKPKVSAKRKELDKSPSNSRANLKVATMSLINNKKERPVNITPNKISASSRKRIENDTRKQPESAEKLSSFNNTFKCNISESLHDDSTVYDIIFLPKYHGAGNTKIVSSKTSQEGKVTKVYSNGKTEMLFPNGVRRESFADGYTIVYFNNKDIKQTYPDGKVVYYFAEARTTQSTFVDGLQVFKFPNNQVEKHYLDGHKEITYDSTNPIDSKMEPSSAFLEMGRKKVCTLMARYPRRKKAE